MLALSLGAVLAGCAAPRKYQPDTGLIEQWNGETRPDVRADFPYVARYRDGSKRLSYLAVRHHEGETFALLEKEFSTLRPQAVVVDGSPTEKGFSPEESVGPLRKRSRSEIVGGKHSEMAFASWLAVQAGIPFIGGEPS